MVAPPGPAWALHLFHTVSTALMLFWYVRYVRLANGRDRRGWSRSAIRVILTSPRYTRSARAQEPGGCLRPDQVGIDRLPGTGRGVVGGVPVALAGQDHAALDL